LNKLTSIFIDSVDLVAEMTMMDPNLRLSVTFFFPFIRRWSFTGSIRRNIQYFAHFICGFTTKHVGYCFTTDIY